MDTPRNAHPHVVVTGASQGIGRAVAVALASRGARITAVARHAQALDALVAQLPGDGHQALPTDLSSRAQLEALCSRVAQGGVDVLINNAGVGAYGVFHQQSPAVLSNVLAVNVDAVVALSHAFLRAAAPGSALVNVASTLAFLPMADHAVYAASKAFVQSLSTSLWAQYRARGIHVAALCPGVTATQFQQSAGAQPGQAAPGLITQQPQDVATALLELLDHRLGPVVVCGAVNRAMVAGGRVLPLGVLARVLGTQRRGPAAAE